MLGRIDKTEPELIESFPTDLGTPMERAAWMLGRLLEQAPALARPVIRSMLLPRLETLNSEDLIASLAMIKDQVLPWVMFGDTGHSASDDDDPEVPGYVEPQVLQDQSGREGALRRADGEWQDDLGRSPYPDDGVSNGRHRPEA